MALIYKYYKDEIENMLSLKMLIDCQFVDTVKIIRALATVYVLFVMLPFQVQLYATDKQVVTICHIPMTFMNFLLLCMEGA